MGAREDGEQFLAENKKYDDVHETKSGLQYTIKQEGSGPKPGPTDTVEVNYHGTFINNKSFDSTYDRGEPITFALNSVIKGWQEGLQLMSVGAVYKFYIPHHLAYGETGAAGIIPPYTTLIFEVELLDIK